MTRVAIIVEGATEESFVKGPLAEALWAKSVFVTPIILGVPGHKGGRTSYARLQKDLIRQLKQDQNAYCSTMIDFYGMGQGFPGTPTPEGIRSIERVEHIESEIKKDICQRVPDYRPQLRLIPYLSLHEYEALLFSDCDELAKAMKQTHLATRLRQIRDEVRTPEDIDDSPETAPSKRLTAIYPGYRKVLEGTLAARAVGIQRMREQCEHFRIWMERLESLEEI